MYVHANSLRTYALNEPDKMTSKMYPVEEAKKEEKRNEKYQVREKTVCRDRGARFSRTDECGIT